MPTSLVLTVIGLDRPGLVELIADTAARHRANWEASRMARLGERFAGIVLLTADDARATDLERALHGLRERGLTIVVERNTAAELPRGRRLKLELLGPDRPGIVKELTTALAARQVNVEELHTEVASAPMSGEPLFRLTAALRPPDGLALAALQATLRELAQDLAVDLSVDEGDGPR